MPAHDAYAAFRHRDFRLLQAKRFAATLASQAQTVAVGWHIYLRTGRPLDLGYVGLAQFVPVALLSLVAGSVADRFDRRRVLLVSQSVLTLCALALFVLARGGPIWPMYGVLAVIGAARAFAGPADQALLTHVVPESVFPSAVAWSSSLWQTATIAGPALGGLLIRVVGIATTFAVAAGLSAIGLAALAVLKARGRGEGRHRATSLDELFAGVRFVFSRKIVLGALSLDLFAVLFGGATALLPVYAKEILNVGVTGLGALRSAPALGAAVMAAFVAHHPIRRHVGVATLLSVAAFGAATIAFGLSRNFLLSLAILVFLGAADMVSVVIRTTLVQIATPEAMRGRVSAVNSIFVVASNELGELESGLTAEWLGAQRAVVLGGIGALVTVAVAWLAFGELRRVDEISRKELTGENP